LLRTSAARAAGSTGNTSGNTGSGNRSLGGVGSPKKQRTLASMMQPRAAAGSVASASARYDHDDHHDGMQVDEPAPLKPAAAAAAKPAMAVVGMAGDDDDDDDDDGGVVPSAAAHMTVTRPALKVAGWEQVRAVQAELEEKAEVRIEAGSLPLTQLPSGDAVLRMYWLDAYEPEGRSGAIYLFGKVGFTNHHRVFFFGFVFVRVGC
jgi:hypothetical protein